MRLIQKNVGIDVHTQFGLLFPRDDVNETNVFLLAETHSHIQPMMRKWSATVNYNWTSVYN